ncbi:CBS domain-containing protein [bacterium]|nr:CBS domain-containing protein [bacterium]
MKIRDVMQSNVQTVVAESPAREAYELMRQGRFHHLPVVGPAGQVVGIVSDRDILSVAVLFAKRPQSPEDYLIDERTKVAEVMTAGPATIGPDADLAGAVEQMVSQGISALPVVDQGKLVAIVTDTDLLRLLVKLVGQA